MTENINFIITDTQAEVLCKYYGEDINSLLDWEIAELLDKLIDEAHVRVMGRE